MIEFGPKQRKILEQTIDQYFSNNVLDKSWRSHFYFSTVFESADRLFTPATGSVQGIDENGLVMEVDSGTTTTSMQLDIPSGSLLTFDRPIRARTAISMSSVADFEWQMQIASASTDYIGWQIDDNQIQGFTYDGTLHTVNIGTASVSTYYELEYRYIPQKRVVFLVDGVEKGIIESTTGLPDPNVSPDAIFFTEITRTSGTATKSVIVPYLELIQAK